MFFISSLWNLFGSFTFWAPPALFRLFLGQKKNVPNFTDDEPTNRSSSTAYARPACKYIRATLAVSFHDLIKADGRVFLFQRLSEILRKRAMTFEKTRLDY